MRYWLIKFAPFRTSWADIVRAGTFTLRGVRSPEARRNLAAMRVGDAVLFYHSQQERTIVGMLEVTREAYPDPTSSNPRWVTCDFTPVRTFASPISLATVKADQRLATLALVRQPRLAVIPVPAEMFDVIVDTGRETGVAP